MHRCLPLLKNRRKLVFLHFMNVDAQSSNLVLLERCRNQNLQWNAMHDVNNERRGYDKEGSSTWHLCFRDYKNN
jgi:hypothetical protein